MNNDFQWTWRYGLYLLCWNTSWSASAHCWKYTTLVNTVLNVIYTRKRLWLNDTRELYVTHELFTPDQINIKSYVSFKFSCIPFIGLMCAFFGNDIFKSIKTGWIALYVTISIFSKNKQKIHLPHIIKGTNCFRIQQSILFWQLQFI